MATIILSGLPIDIVCHICKFFKPRKLVEFTKGDIDAFLINDCYKDQPDKLLYAFVKKQRLLSLNRLLKGSNPSQYNLNTVKTAYSYAARNGDFPILSVLTKYLNVFSQFLSDIPISLTVVRILRLKSEDDLSIINKHLSFIEYYISMTTSICEREPLNIFTLLKILEHPYSTRIMYVLFRHKIIEYMIKMRLDDCMFNELVTSLIINNHIVLLKHFIKRGYAIKVGDVVIALARSNYEMVRYVLHKFKPRVYSNKFVYWMLRMAHVRNDPRMYEAVDCKLRHKKY